MTNEIEVIVMIPINSWQVAPKTLIDDIEAMAIEVAPVIPPGENVTTELICGPDYWKPASTYQKQLVGMVMAFLVRKRRVPYEKSGRPCQTPKVYSTIY